MPRKARIDAPGALHHIIVRGIDRTAIFLDEADRESFLSRLGRLLTESSTPCLAWALMGNHAHLLLRTGHVPIATLMRRLLTGYAQQFNRRHRRRGVLFQNRYKSILCEEDAYLLELVRYIHLNPVRVGVTPDMQALRDYPGCGHSALIGRIPRDWQAADYVLGFFGKTLRAARKAYLDFVARGLPEGSRPELVGGGLIRSAGGWEAVKALRHSGMRVMGDERILGSGEFVESVLSHAREQYEKKTLALRSGIGLDTVIGQVAVQLGVDPARIGSAGRQRALARARSLVCALAMDRLGMNGRELARRLNLSASAVCKLAQRGRTDELNETSGAAIFKLQR